MEAGKKMETKYLNWQLSQSDMETLQKGKPLTLIGATEVIILEFTPRRVRSVLHEDTEYIKEMYEKQIMKLSKCSG